MWTAQVVLDVTAKTASGDEVFNHQEVWQEIGTDLNGDQQFKAWKIKNTIDLAIQPRRTYTKTLTIPFPNGTLEGSIEATLSYIHTPKEKFIVHQTARTVSFPGEFK